MSRSPAGPRLRRIELHECSVRLGRHWAVREVSLEIAAGQRWLLLGPNGAGKTVLLKLLRGDLWPTPTGRESRRYFFADATVDDQPVAAFERIAYLGPERQDRYLRRESTLSVAQVVLTGYDDSDFPLRPATRAQSRRIDEVLAAVGLRGVRERPFLRLSYGQRRRVLLARSLVRTPDVLLLDEALNGLDATGRRAFLRALRRAVPLRTTWVLSSHRRSDIDEAGVTHVARIRAGRIESAAPLAAEGPASKDDGRARNTARAQRPTVERSRRPSSKGAGGATRLAASDTGARPLLEVERAAVFREDRAVIAAFDWVLRPGEHWYVRGRNGSGKSTLIAMLYGDLWPRHGARLRRRWPGVEDWKRRVGLVSPELQASYSATGCTVEEIVTSGLQDSIGLNFFATPTERRRVARELRSWGLASLAARHARELSYGQLRLVLAARAFVRPRRLFLLDEPFDGLDAEARARLRARLDRAVLRGATVVLSSHHEDDVPDYVARTLTLRTGRAPAVGRRGPQS